MSPSEPGPAVAADYLATDARMRASVKAASQRFVGWLIAFAALNVVYLTALGLLTEDRPVLWLTAAYLLSTAGLTVSFLGGTRMTPAGFDRRWVQALSWWGVVFAAVLLVGLFAFRGQPAFWLPASLACAVPLVLGARAELRA